MPRDGPSGGEDLDVQRDRAGDEARAVERDDDRRADEARRRAARGRSRVRGRAGDERGQRRDENGRAETTAAGQCLASEQAEAL